MKRNIKMLMVAVLVISMLALLISCGGKNGESSIEVDETPNIDVNSSVDELLGNWVDTSDEKRLVNITEADEGYIWEDNEGAYQATFAEGVLTLTVSEDETATVYVDSESGIMVCQYGGQMTKYQR